MVVCIASSKIYNSSSEARTYERSKACEKGNTVRKTNKDEKEQLTIFLSAIGIDCNNNRVTTVYILFYMKKILRNCWDAVVWILIMMKHI